MLPWLQLTPGGHECVCIVWDIVEKCVHCSSMQCCISCIQLQCHTVKSCGLLQDLTDTIACLSTSHFSKGVCLIHNEWRLFTFVHLMCGWISPFETSQSPHSSPSLFVWLVQYSTHKWTNGQTRNQDCKLPQQSVCMLWSQFYGLTLLLHIPSDSVEPFLNHVRQDIKIVCIPLAPCELIHGTFH